MILILNNNYIIIRKGLSYIEFNQTGGLYLK